MKTQEKFTKALEKIAAARGLDLIVDGSWANVGTYRFQAPDSFTPLMTFPFDFQSNRSSFDPMGGKGGLLDYGPNPHSSSGLWLCVEGAQHDDALALVAATLDQTEEVERIRTEARGHDLTEVSADSIERGDRITLDNGGEPYLKEEPRTVADVSQSGTMVNVEFTDSQPGARFAFDERVWMAPRTLTLSPQARAVIAGFIDRDVNNDEIHAMENVWQELQENFPPHLFAEARDAEGQVV